MKNIEKSTMIILRDGKNYYYSVEDVCIDSGGDGITISYHEDDHPNEYGRVHHISLSEDMASEIAKVILKLTSKENEAS